MCLKKRRRSQVTTIPHSRLPVGSWGEVRAGGTNFLQKVECYRKLPRVQTLINPLLWDVIYLNVFWWEVVTSLPGRSQVYRSLERIGSNDLFHIKLSYYKNNNNDNITPMETQNPAVDMGL